jgi:DNA-binding NarL/FixJ family response regulator
LRTDPGFWSLQDVAMSGSWKAASERVRGFARVVGVVSDIVKNRENHPLTATELLVLELLADGKSAGDIAKDLDRSIYTIRAHTRAIIGKFNVRGRLAAVAYARKAGIIP